MSIEKIRISVKRIELVKMLGGVTTGLGVMLALFINQDAVGQPKQGGTLTVPIITQTFVEDFNPYSGAQGLSLIHISEPTRPY